jgi:DNA-binding response OmpR family regulator
MLLKKIVIAEDDDSIAHMANMALGDAGFLCLRAHDGEEALRLVRMHSPDLLVLDWMMPRLDGLEVVRRLKADVMWSRTPILMLTALGAVENRVEGLEAGADAYMTKPFDLREFAAKAKAMIRGARRERDRNPATDLPGSRAIDEHIEDVLNRGSPVAVVHFDVRAFEQYADVVGFAAAEEGTRAIGEFVLARARAASEGSAFVGHLGGSDFLAALAREPAEALAHEVIAAFERHRAAWFPGGDELPLAMTVAVATTEGLAAGEMDKLSKRLASAMRTAKKAEGSNAVVWSEPG